MKNRKNHRALRFQQRNAQRAVRQQENQQRDQQRRDESGHPRQARVALLVRLLVGMGKMRLQPGLADDIAAVEEHGGLEEAVRDQMEDGEGERSEAAFHDHVPHLADRREPEHVLDVVLGQHHGGAEHGRQRSNEEGHVQRRRTQPEQAARAG